MVGFQERPFRSKDHGSFEEEWGCHKRTSEWWYVTGYFRDDQDKLYSYQFTLLRFYFHGLHPYCIMLALTDFSTGKHYYMQKATLLPRGITIGAQAVEFAGVARVAKGVGGMELNGRHSHFALDLALDYGKGATWHCEDGVLRMGLDVPKETTLYYSYTNMPTAGTMTLDGVTRQVRGKSWFDRQGGPYSVLNRWTHWEWFSLRFYDDEEMMLFSFPQSGYQDGTYVPRLGPARRLNDYAVTPLGFLAAGGNKYSSGWTLRVPGLKQESYTITPLLAGQVNIGYLEQLAGIYNTAGEEVGMCFVELLPGVYNEKFAMVLFKKAE